MASRSTLVGDGMAQVALQVLRFAAVGLANTGIDLAVTNLLVLATGAQGGLALLVVSVVACAAATANSYALNRRWTFHMPHAAGDTASLRKFLGVAALSMVVNTSVFLFATRYLPDRLGVPHLLAVNLGKLAGVAAAFAVSFLGYRLGVFQTESVQRFRRSFSFAVPARGSAVAQATALVAVATLVRLGYLTLTTAVYGDAVNYARVARSIAAGRFAEVDAFWSNLFCFWQSVLHLVVPGVLLPVIASTLVPGVLLVLPVVGVARFLYGARAAWLAGALCAVHPRLVEYSCNGYAESLYLLAFATGTALLVELLRSGRISSALGFGAAFGAYASVRPEALAAFAGSVLILLLVVARRNQSGVTSDSTATTGPSLGRAAVGALAATAAMLLVVASYAALSHALLGSSALLQKAGNLSKQYSEQLDWERAAQEAYGAGGSVLGAPRPAPPLTHTALTLLRRFPRNAMYSLERLPGVLLSPAILLALLLPLLTRRRGEEAPVAWMAAFPLLFYPLIQVEPRLLFPLLVPINVFAAAGLEAVAAWVSPAVQARRLVVVLGAALVVMSATLSAWRAVDLEQGYQVHRRLASWIEAHVAAGEPLVGCGYGYVSTTAFLTGNPPVPRLWTNDPGELAPFVDSQGSAWLILYERFIRTTNPGLEPVLDEGVPGFALAFQVRDDDGLRVQVYHRHPARDHRAAPPRDANGGTG